MTSSSNAESPTTAPNSVDQSNSKHSLSKDKQCPFCHQSFTSSSLGRHLDLYIKEKNPKPPDGVHDVESIRKIREKITRRHARGLSSTTAAGSGSPSSRKGSAGDGNNNTTRSGGSSAAASARPQPLEPTPGQPTPTMQQGKTNGTFNERPEQQININRMNWHATGVMNDIPPRLAGPDGRADNDVAATNSPLNTSAANFAGKTQQQQQQQQSTSGTPAADQDRSNSICFDNVPNTNKTPVEQALKDILISIQLAVGRSQHPQPFDFDIFEHSFPALCLRMLPVPKNLFSTTPTTSVETWSALDPPSRDCYDALRESLRNRLKIYYSMFPPTELRLPRTRADGEAMIARKVESEKGKYMKHLSDVFERWEALSQKEKDRVWLLELARVYAWEIQEHAGTRRKLDKAEDDIEALKVQIERMTGQLQQQQQQQQNGQNNSYTGGAFDPWARSASSSSLAPIGANATKAPILSTAAARELARTELAASNWDYNAILERYKSGAALPSSAPPSTNAPNPSNQSNAGFPQQQQQQSPPNNGGWTSPPPFPQASGTTVGAAGQWVQPVAPSMSQPPSNQAPQTFSSPFGRPNSGGIHQQNSSGTNSANNGTPRMGNPSRGMSGNSGMINRTPSNPHPLPPSTGPTPPQSTIHKTSYAPPHQQQQQRNFYNQSHHHQQGAPVDAGFLMNAGGQRISATGVVNTASGAGPGDGDVDMG